MPNTYLKKIRNVPTLPNILAKLISTLDDPRSSAKDLELILRNDQALTAKLLSVANSAYYAFRHRITSVRRAAVAIGFAEVRNICMGLSLMGFLHPNTFPDKDAAEFLWLHSLMTAEGARVVAESCGVMDQDSAYTVGLLHDMGKVVQAAFFHEDILKLKSYALEKGIAYHAAEKELSLDHQLVGRALAINWQMPAMFADVMGRHHNPSPHTPFYQPSCLAHCANYLAHLIQPNDEYYPSLPPLIPEAMKAIGLTQGMLTLCRQKLSDREEMVMTLWDSLITV